MPSKRYVPAVGRSRQPSTFSSVDLPEPDGPTMASESPGSSRRSTSRRATTGGSLPNVRPTPASSTTAGSARTSCSRRDRGAAAERAAERLTGRLRRAGDARRAGAVLGARQGPAPAGWASVPPDDHEVAAAQPLAARRPHLHVALGRQARHDADELGAAAGAHLDARAAVAADRDRAHRDGEDRAARAVDGDREPHGRADEGHARASRGSTEK